MVSCVIQKAGNVPKRRACDECRTRKLACTKDPGGCERCSREGITCVYSPQKPMGRPRKRRAADDADDADHADRADHADHVVVVVDDHARTDASRPPVVTQSRSTGSFSSGNESSFAHDFDFLPRLGDGANANYLDLLPNNFEDIDSTPLYSLPQPSYHHHVFGSCNDSLGGSSFPLDMTGTDTGTVILQSIDFNEPELRSSSMSRDVDHFWQQRVSDQALPPEETPPSMSSGISSTGEPPEPPTSQTTHNKLPSLPSAVCGCLSSLYLALESLNHLPPDIPSAMRVTRSATKVAQDVLDCHRCSNCFFRDPPQPPPVQALQNMMCLGALVPSACNAYATILEMIDSETEAAKKNNRHIFFSSKDVGGLWELVTDEGEGGGSCSALEANDNKALDPDMWRTTVRSILQLDVYGLGGRTGESIMGRHSQRGLKDVINHLGRTARVRHEMMDELVAAGKMPKKKQSKYLLHHHASIPPEQRNCTRLVESARLALDSLIIQ